MSKLIIIAVIALLVFAYFKASSDTRTKVNTDVQSVGNFIIGKIQGNNSVGKINCTTNEQCIVQYGSSNCDLNNGNCVKVS